MEYSKAELEELTYNAEINLNYIKNTGDGKGLMEKIDEEIPYLGTGSFIIPSIRIKGYIDRLFQRLPTIKNCIFATDNIPMANETYITIAPVWIKYINNADRLEKGSEKETAITATIDKIKWKIDRYNIAHPGRQDTPTASPSAKEETKSRTIKEIELGKCFNAKFKGAGNNPNHFNNLVADLKSLTTIKDCSAVALMIWESKTGFINSFSTFSKWCRFFFDCIGVEVKPNYNYSRKEQANNKLKNKFYYL